MAERMSYAYVAVEVGGIQNYIFATGKLKEVIGASQAIELVTAEETWRPILERLGLPLLQEPAGDRWAMKLQAQAGSLRLLLPAGDWGRRFLGEYAREVLGRWPGLPLDGALVEPATIEEVADRTADHRKAKPKIARQRALRPPDGLPLNPFVEMAPLDGRAAAGKDRLSGQWLSRHSLTRRDESLLEKAKDRLTANFDGALQEALPVGARIEWRDDLDELLDGQEKRRVALIHIDGNDLGQFFLKEAGHCAVEDLSGLARYIKKMDGLSGLIAKANQKAFSRALAAAAAADRAGHARAAAAGLYRAPFRPLVMGGDDLTALVRADLAFDFLSAFVAEYEKETSKHKLSLGVGMVIMPASYPFLKAYHLAEALCSTAKAATAGEKPRHSSLDYVVISGETDNDLASLRQRAVADDGSRLTAKPFKLEPGFLEDFLEKTDDVLERLPRAHTRGALEACRRGRAAAKPAFDKLRENIHRGLGGRQDRALMSLERFDEIFPEDFFERSADQAGYKAALADYLELRDYRPQAG